jgi:PRTRC genetic system protein B
MTSIVTGPTGADIALRSAMLLYGSEDGTARYATVHPVVADPKTARPVIGAGQPLDRDALLLALKQINEAAAPKAEFLPGNVIGLSPKAVTWWCPPALRRVFFKCKDLGGERSGIVPHPGLIFRASVDGFSVFAVKGAARPSPDTPVFEPPYFNTWDHGRICIGSARVPKRIDVKSIAGWEFGFFDSAFTHPNVGGKRLSYPNGEFAFWRDMLEGQFADAFPEEVLVPMKASAQQVVAGKFGGRV